MSGKGSIAVSELLGKAFAAGYIEDRVTLDEFESFDFDEVLDRVSSLIVQAGDNPESVLREWNIIE